MIEIATLRFCISYHVEIYSFSKKRSHCSFKWLEYSSYDIVIESVTTRILVMELISTEIRVFKLVGDWFKYSFLSVSQ